MYNLGEILTTYTPQERTLRDDTLLEDCAKFEKQYIEKFMKEVRLYEYFHVDLSFFTKGRVPRYA